MVLCEGTRDLDPLGVDLFRSPPDQPRHLPWMWGEDSASGDRGERIEPRGKRIKPIGIEHERRFDLLQQAADQRPRLRGAPQPGSDRHNVNAGTCLYKRVQCGRSEVSVGIRERNREHLGYSGPDDRKDRPRAGDGDESRSSAESPEGGHDRCTAHPNRSGDDEDTPERPLVPGRWTARKMVTHLSLIHI